MKIPLRQKKALKELINLSEALHLYDIEASKKNKMFYTILKLSPMTAIEFFCGFERAWLGTLHVQSQIYRGLNKKLCYNFSVIIFGFQFEFSIYEEKEEIVG